jgi:hypothetical protein
MESFSSFPVGKSPFRAKGVVYNNFCAFVDMRLVGGMKDFLRRVRDPALRDFHAQRFLAASWYDALPVLSALHELGRELQVPPLSLMSDLSRFNFNAAVNGVYRLLLRLTSPETLLERSTQIGRQYFDFVKTDFARLGPRHYRLRHAGIPDTVAPMYMTMVEAFVDIGLAHAGAKEVRQRWENPEPMGMMHGLPVVRLQREITWR